VRDDSSASYYLGFLGTVVAYLSGFSARGSADLSYRGSGADTARGPLVSGAVIGLAQWLALRFTFNLWAHWILATSLGMAVGLALAMTFFGTNTEMTFLLARAVITGFMVGVAQAVVLRKTFNPLLWTTAITLFWSLAWFITSAVIRQNLANDYAVFGSSGAIVFTVLIGFVLLRARRQ
jgi:hypothetical protein